MLLSWKSAFGFLSALISLSLLNAVGPSTAHERGKSDVAEHLLVAQKSSDSLTVELVGKPASDADSSGVLDALKKLMTSLAQRDLDQIGNCLGQDVTMFDEHNGKVLFGKESVLEHIKEKVIGTGSTKPVKRIVVHDPFVDVKGDTAMVSYWAIKEMNDERGTKLESWCSEVYERKDGQWLVLQFKCNWKPAHKSDT